MSMSLTNFSTRHWLTKQELPVFSNRISKIFVLFQKSMNKFWSCHLQGMGFTCYIILKKNSRFCEIRQYFKSVFELFEGSRDRQTLMMGGNARYISDLARFSTLPNLSGMTGSQLLSLSRQIWECFKLSESTIMSSEKSEIQCAVDVNLSLIFL